MTKEKMRQMIEEARKDGLACVVEDELCHRNTEGFGPYRSRKRDLYEELVIDRGLEGRRYYSDIPEDAE